MWNVLFKWVLSFNEAENWSNISKGCEKLQKIMWLLHIEVVVGFSNGGIGNFEIETKQGFYNLSVILFKQVFSFAKLENLPWWIKTVKIVPNSLISIGKFLSEVHIEAQSTIELWNVGNDFRICRWRFINKFQFSMKWNSIVMDQKETKLVMKLYD